MKNCNYVSLILNNNIYSYGLQYDLNIKDSSNIIKNDTICFNTQLNIDGDSYFVLRDKLNSLLSLYNANEDVTIVYLGYALSLSPIIDVLNELLSTTFSYLKSCTILTSEAVLNDFSISNNSSKTSVYSIQLKPTELTDDTKLIYYYTNLLEPLIQSGVNYTTLYNTYKKIPWLLEFIMITLNCTYQDIEVFPKDLYKNLPNCTFKSNRDNLATSKLSLFNSQYIRYLIYTFTAFSYKLNETLKHCSNCSEFLNNDSMINLIQAMRNQILNFTNNDLIPYNLRGIFNITNGKFISNNDNIYSLYDYNKRSTVSSDN